MRAQSPRRPAGEPRVLSGAVLRLNPDTAAGVTGNPMYNASAPSSNASRILAFGMRNPFRFTMRPNTNEIWVADVGWGIYEEIDRIMTPTPAKAPNFGWPCVEDQTHLSGYRDLDMCKALYNDTADPPTDPYFAYAHGEKVNANDTCGFADGSAITGDAFYTGSRYPASYSNALFFGDDVRNCIYVMTAGCERAARPVDRPDVHRRLGQPDAGRPRGRPGVEGHLLRQHRRWNGQPDLLRVVEPSARPHVATATPTSGAAPLSVQLNGSTSTDPDGDTLTYSWDTDGNGTFGDATGKTPTVSYPNGGTFQARLLVTDPSGLSNTSGAVGITVTAASGPVNTARPVVGGPTQVGTPMIASTGTWTGVAPITYARQWQRCTTSSVTTCSDIANATGPAYSPQVADQGKHDPGPGDRDELGWHQLGHVEAGRARRRGHEHAADAGDQHPRHEPHVEGRRHRQLLGLRHRHPGRHRAGEPALVDIILGHCTTTGCHTHPLATRTGVASGTIAAPDHQAPSYIELTLTATDASGATASTVRRIEPEDGEPDVQDEPRRACRSPSVRSRARRPRSPRTWVVNSQVQLNAPTPADGRRRRTTRSAAGQHGGAATHTVKAPATATTYTATYGSGACSGNVVLFCGAGRHTVDLLAAGGQAWDDRGRCEPQRAARYLRRVESAS